MPGCHGLVRQAVVGPGKSNHVQLLTPTTAWNTKPWHPNDPLEFNPLRNLGQMASLIVEASGVSVAESTERLERERKRPGHAVADDFRARGVPRYAAGPAMDAFYGATDAFLYELAVWNRNR